MYPKEIVSFTTTTPSISAMSNAGGLQRFLLKAANSFFFNSGRHFFYKQNLSHPSRQTSSQTDSKGRQDKRSYNGLFNSGTPG